MNKNGMREYQKDFEMMTTESPNILFLVIDALPAYRLYQHDKTAITPNIDLLMEKGVHFDQAITCADLTPVSVGSMFTGSFPFRTMIRGGLKVWKLKKNAINCINIFFLTINNNIGLKILANV